MPAPMFSVMCFNLWWAWCNGSTAVCGTVGMGSISRRSPQMYAFNDIYDSRVSEKRRHFMERQPLAWHTALKAAKPLRAISVQLRFSPPFHGRSVKSARYTGLLNQPPFKGGKGSNPLPSAKNRSFS